ncbi:MAG TPA: alpha/beta fold hydrolase [Kofleriaceae bacterium]|jgi:medium-chain acyl-[acyl-carrier-protein] hydrolase|nr:alpha/beta fold hydrolase [Kofleriaceae bacterium]
MAPGPANPWIVRPRPNPGAALRLVCFPYAGGGANVFRTWPKALPAEIELWAIELPGRETRLKETPLRELSPLITALTDAVAPQLQAPFAIYGHSLGALIGFCFARELRRRSQRGPVHLFVSGRRAPQIAEPSPAYNLPEPQFLARLRSLGGVPDALFQDPQLLAFYLPVLRADFALGEAEMAPPDEPLDCPITALGGERDEKATLDELDAWSTQTRAAFERETFPGGHFFLQSARDALLGSLSRRLSRIMATL